MAIGFNLQGIPGQIRGTPEEAGAVPDLGQLMMQGFSNSLDMANKPRTIAQDYLTRELNNKIRNAQARYAEPMAKTGYDQALANLQQQNLVNKYYGRMRESELSGQGLTQEHQRMVNEQLRRTLDRQKRYDELLEYYRQQGATPEQAHSLAIASVNQTHPEPQEAPQQQQDLAQTILGASIPDYLSNIAPQPQGQTAPFNAQNAPYTPISESGIGLGYTPFSLKKEMLPGQENALHKLIQQNYDERDAALTSAFGSPLQFGLEQKLQNYLLNKTRSPFKTGLSAEAQGYEGMSPIQAPRLQQQEPLAQTFQLPPAPQAAPNYLQRLEAPPAVVPEEERLPVESARLQQPKSYVEQLQQAGYNTANAEPVYAPEDKLYLEQPQYRDLLKSKFPNIGTKQYNDFPRNRVVFTETLPSGATKTTIQPLGGAQGGAPDFKAASPFGKANEDLKHYIQIGDLESAKQMKEYIHSLLDKEGKTQTNFDKAYNEWEKAVEEFGPNSFKAKKYGERLQSLTRGNQTIQLNKGFPITNPQTGEQGYAFAQDKDEKLISGGRAAFNYIYPYLEEGVRPFSGTIVETTTALANAIKNQSVDPNAAKQLENLLLADKIRQSAGIKELRLIGGGMFKKTLESITSALANDQVQKDLKNAVTKNLINRDIQTRVNQRFKDVLNEMTNKETAARDEYVAIYPSEVTLKNNITKGLKKSSNKSNQLKAKPVDSDVIVVTPEMVKGLR